MAEQPASGDSPARPLWSAFDDLGAAYADHADGSLYNAQYDRPVMLAKLGPIAGLDVLDAGCGPGLYAEELLRGGARVTAFDASAAMVELCRARTGGRARVGQAVLGEPLSYDSAAFDRVLCTLMIQYVQEPDKAVAELHRVLRPGGHLLLSTQHPVLDWVRKGGSYWDGGVGVDRWTLASGPVEVPFVRFSVSSLCRAVTDSGLLIAELDEPPPPPAIGRIDPAEYAKMLRFPPFLTIRAIKPG